MSVFIEVIAKRLKKKTNEFEEYQKTIKWKPFYLEKGQYQVPDFDIPKTRDCKIKKELGKILTFIYEKAQGVRKKDACTIMPIPWNMPILKEIWSNVTRGKVLMEKIGLIQEYNNKWRYGAGHFNYGKTYAYFYENEVKFIERCKKDNINPIQLKNYKQLKPQNIQNIDSTKVKIGTGLRLEKPSSMSPKQFEDALTQIIYTKYKQLEEVQKLADEINEKYYENYPEFKISLRLKFKWGNSGKYVTKIKLRATNSLCNLEEKDKQEVLDRYGLHLASDVNCSVPRLNKSMNIGKWFSDGPNRQFETDLYELIFREMYQNEPFTKETRDALKKLLLRSFFERSDDLLIRDVWNNIDQDGLDKKEVEKELVLLNNAVKKVSGPKMYGPEIYYVEACVYLRVLYDLLKDGYLAWIIYDGFYSSGVMMDEIFDSYVKKMIEIEFDSFYKRI